MAKRFVDTKIWDKAWFRRLTPKNKLFWIYLLTKCDHAGIWDADWEAAEFLIGEWVDYNELPPEITDKMEYIKGDDQYFIPKFVEFQYGVLKANSKTLKDKAKYKVKDKLKVKEREQIFIDYCKQYYKKFDISDVMLVDFVNYWTEINPDGKKMRFEMEKVFNHKRRLVKWKENSKKWEKPKKEHKSFEAKFGKTKTGLYLAYCSRCGKKETPNDSWQLKDGSNCCRVEYVETKPSP